MNIVRPYVSSDRDGCLDIFEGNVPSFFADSNRSEFSDFLTSAANSLSYQVVQRGERIIACGGHYILEDGLTARLCWGMVDRDMQRTGIGRVLIEARVRAAKSISGVTHIMLGTSQHTQAFYARFGFQTTAITKDGYGEGLDRWDIILRV